MYDARNLKSQILVSETHVECPVQGCSQRVTRQHRVFRVAPQFQCPEHHLYISPSTFEYPTTLDNLLWKEEQDVLLLKNIMENKRESRMARQNSEDALSWNVFRYLEKTDELSAILSCIMGRDLGALKLVYWSYAPILGVVWPELTVARQEFGESSRRSTEPDLIAFSDKAVLFIEAKFTADNKTTPSDPENRKRYVTGGNGWYDQVFKFSYDAVAIKAKQYELLRLWLLGSWIASQSRRNFYLVNLVRQGYEQAIEERFGYHIKVSAQRRFVRMTWEEMAQHITVKISPSADRDVLLDYLRYSTLAKITLTAQKSKP